MPKNKPLKKGAGYAATLRKVKAEQKEFLAKEKEKYKNPPNPFFIGEEVIFTKHRNEDRKAHIVKVNMKTYTVEDTYGTRYRVDKMSLGGLPTEFDKPGMTTRMEIGEYIKIKKVTL